MSDERKNKKITLILILSIIILILVILILSILPTTCKKKKLSNGASWISYLDDMGSTKKVNMPYCIENVEALCKNTNSATYDIRIGLNSFFQVDHNKICGINFGKDWDEMTVAPDWFCGFLFANNVNMFTDLNLPKNITTIGDFFLSQMFSQNTNDKINFSLALPLKIKNAGNNFCDGMFSNCSSLQSIPTSFIFPPNISSNMGDNFCYQMFMNCSSLEFGNDERGTNLHIPNASVTEVNYCGEMFKSCTILNDHGVLETPSPGSDISIKRSL